MTRRRQPYSPLQRWLPLPELPALMAQAEAARSRARGERRRELPVQGAVYLSTRIRRGKVGKGGKPGKLYLRLRMRPKDTRHAYKAFTVELPLETADPNKAILRGGFLIRSFLRLDLRLLGPLAEFLPSCKP